MFHILELGRFSENMTRFYGAEITLAIGYLHDLKIIYRNIKVYRSIDHAIKVVHVVASLCF